MVAGLTVPREPFKRDGNPLNHDGYLDYGIYVCFQVPQPLPVSLPLPAPPPMGLHLGGEKAVRPGSPVGAPRPGLFREGRGQTSSDCKGLPTLGKLEHWRTANRALRHSLVPADAHAPYILTHTRPR